MKLVLVRHSEVIPEYKGKYNGHIDIPLSKQGLKDAQTLGEQLKSYTFDAIYCSDLLRCRETLEQFKLPMQTIFTDQLREKSWGKHEGMSFAEIELSGLKYTNFSQWLEDLDGETVTEFQQRVHDFFFKELQNKQHNVVLIVTHAGVIKTLLALKESLGLEESFAKLLPYSSITELVL